MKNIKNIESFHAEKLTYVIFSRFEDLLIQESIFDDGFDYLIDINHAGKQTGRFFGVEVKAIHQDLDKTLKSIQFEKYANFKIPIVLVLVNSILDQCFYIWIQQPSVNGKLKLQSVENQQLQTLDNESVQSIIEEIKKWYEGK